MKAGGEATQIPTALVVDDDPMIVKALSRILKKDGYAVHVAAHGGEALQAFEEAEFTIVLADVNMPGMDGFELCSRILENPRAVHLPVVLVSGRVSNQDVERGLDVGAADYIKKPFDSAEVRMRVRTQIHLHETLRQQDALRTQLAHAQKLEAVGQLASGIAHEINTPTQFVSDSIYFIKEAFEDLWEMVAQTRRAVEAVQDADTRASLLKALDEAEEDADFEYLDENLPGSFVRCTDGLKRIAAIVGAMKEFAHPGKKEMQAADLNQALKATLTIAKNEYKYVADAVLELGDLPAVMCHIGDLNQVFLNLIVNAAHAISDVVGDSGERGTIYIRTQQEAGLVRIEFEDSGSGIPEAVQARIFEPSFTTKEVGVGSGQGLAIARSIIVDKHQGTLAFETTRGQGTTFIITIPDGSGGGHSEGAE